MIKVATTSDNHLDVNKLDIDTVLQAQAQYLVAQKIDYYLIAGDQFNDFTKTQDYVAKMQQIVGKAVKIYFIAGNHEMVNGFTYPELQLPIEPAYLHQKFVDIPGTNYRIIGNNGWYDYTYASPLTAQKAKTAADFSRWRNAYWIDGGIQGRADDLRLMQQVLNVVHQQFMLAKQEHKEVIFITHFVPQQAYIFYTPDRTYWNMATALMGSQRLGDLIQAYQIEHVIFGHLHLRQKPKTLMGVTYHTAPVGYGLKRINEWSSSNFMQEWQKTLQIIQI